MGDCARLGRGELGSVESKAQRGLDARSQCLGVAEAEDAEVVDLCLDKGGIVEVDLGSHLEVDPSVGGRLGVVGGTGTGLDVGVDAVVVRGRVGGEVAQALQGDGVLGGVEAGSEVVLGHLGSLDVVRGLGTSEETVTAQDGVGSEDGSLEEVEELAGVESWLLVGGSYQDVLCLLVGEEAGDELQFEALGNVVLQLNVVAQDIGSGPGLGEVEAVLPVLEFGLEVTGDGTRLGVSDTENLEGDAGGGPGLDLECGAVDGAVR